MGRFAYIFAAPPLFALLLITSPLEAQKNCKKGIPCGNTCIAANKVCRIGGSTPPPAATAAPLLDVSLVAVRDDRAPFVAFKEGVIYYRNVVGCEAARVPKKADRVYFKTETDAKSVGLTPSSEQGCQGL